MEVEWLILADAAQIVGGKLYLLGGGWDRITVSKLPSLHHLALAMAVRVPWNETNQRRQFEVEVADEDGNRVMKANGQLEVGRPPGVPPGQAQRAQTALQVNFEIKKLGTYVVNARLDGEEGRSFPFNIVPGPMLARDQKPPQGEDNV